MTGEAIKLALAALQQRYADKRVHFFDIELVEAGEGGCRLAGRVLDKDTLAAVRAELTRQFPDLNLDTAQVQTLRRQPAQMVTVATNLMALKGEPAPGAETMSQMRAGVRLEYLMEQGKWAFVRQQDGYLGWAYRPYLSEEAPAPATHIVGDPLALLHAEPAANSPLVGRLLAGSGVTLGQQHGAWVQATPCGYRSGWLAASALRALDALPAEATARRAQMVRDAYAYTGVPYLWGGVSILGIDCSGFSQLLHHLCGVAIPRDADMQWRAGKPVEPPFAAGDLLFFGSGAGHRPISHVGMSLGGWRMIHSSGPRNGVYMDDVQEEAWLRDIFVSARTFLSGAD